MDIGMDVNIALASHFLKSSHYQAIGQEAHKLPSVFSFFRPEYRPPGRITSAGLVSPESQGMLENHSLYYLFGYVKANFAISLVQIPKCSMDLLVLTCLISFSP
jgi:hypothetical protein